jgi:ABC-type amino acid transport substrate-binding protein
MPGPIPVLLSLFCLTLLPAAAAARILLDTNVAPPYQVEVDGKLAGTAVDTLDCVFRAIGMPYSARVVPWRRARFNVQNGLSEGMFSAMPFAEIDQYATLSAPLALEKWYWFGLSEQNLYDDSFPLGRRLGAVLGSNQSGWLAERGIAVAEEVTSVSQLINLLENDRIDAFLADMDTLNLYLAEHAERPLIYSRFEKYTPLAVYFSNNFLRARPDFLDRFNHTMFRCNTASVQLSDTERGKLLRMVEARLIPLAESTEVITALVSANAERRQLVPADIRRLDAQWMAEMTQPEQPLIRKIIDDRLSQYLRVVEEKSAGLYTEILVMDRLGLNVGISRISSDYWQGDEDKYLKAFPPGGQGIFIDRIQYDESTRKFQVQVSIRVQDGTTGKPVGVMTVGIDVEAMLQE